MQTSIAININATPKKIMSVLTNAGNFTKWNSTVLFIEGEIKKGGKINLTSSLYPKHLFTFTVTELTNEQMIWKGGIGKLFNGSRSFSVRQLEDGTTDFRMVEIFKGISLPFVKKFLPDLPANFKQYAEDLKAEVEK